MEVSAATHTSSAVLHGGYPLLRLHSDEKLVALIRHGNQGAFEALISRYNSRLFAFCRHMLGSKEDAEDILQEVFTAAYNALLADERAINARPWLYRIARNRCLNHLRRAQAIGVDSMDIHIAEGGTTTADKVHSREEFRLLMVDVQSLPETQRTALLLREIDALSYDQISQVMDTTVPSIKSLLVRARVSLAEAAEARQLSCEEVRLELGEVAEGLKRISPPVRRHVRTCERCRAFKSQLKQTNRQLAMMLPIGLLVPLKKLLLGKLALGHIGTTAASGGASVAGSAAASGAVSAGLSTVATKAAAGIAAAALITVGTVEVKQVAVDKSNQAAKSAVVALAEPAPVAPPVLASSTPQTSVAVSEPEKPETEVTTAASDKTTTTASQTEVAQTSPKTQEVSETIALPTEDASTSPPAVAPPGETAPTAGTTAPPPTAPAGDAPEPAATTPPPAETTPTTPAATTPATTPAETTPADQTKTSPETTQAS